MAPALRRPTPVGGIAAGPQPLAGTDRRWRLVGMVGVYRAIFRASIAVMLQYRIALLIWMLAHITEPLIHLVVWDHGRWQRERGRLRSRRFRRLLYRALRGEPRDVHLDHLRV